MTGRKAALAPQQARSRETLKRLLRAAAELLEERGLEGTTIPRIAARAGVSPGAVYRRFRDKDALLRTLLLETLERSDEHAAATFTPELAQGHSLSEFVQRLVARSLESHRKHSGLLRALTQFARSHPNAAFRKRVDEIEVRNFRRIMGFALAKRTEVAHPTPEIAVPFALLLLAFTLREMVVLQVLSPAWLPVLPKNDEQLVEELTRALLAYLGCKEEKSPQRRERNSSGDYVSAGAKKTRAASSSRMS